MSRLDRGSTGCKEDNGFGSLIQWRKALGPIAKVLHASGSDSWVVRLTETFNAHPLKSRNRGTTLAEEVCRIAL
jgi:hypothetical protein